VAPVRELTAAVSTLAATQAKERLIEGVKAGHQQAQIANFRVVAANAFRKVGFASVEELAGSKEKLRLVGRDAAGRTLVTEFETHPERGESVSSEVLVFAISNQRSCSKRSSKHSKRKALSAWNRPASEPAESHSSLRPASSFVGR